MKNKILAFFYAHILKPFLFCFSPDLVHKVFVDLGIIIGKNRILRFLLRCLYGTPQSSCHLIVDGITYKGPALLAAGFDYNAHLAPVLWDIGLSGEEVGSVTAKKCLGNPPPNLKRLIQSKSIQVFKGLKNDGVETIIERLKKNPKPKDFVLGISIAKTNDESCAAQDKAIEDYCYSYKRLHEENLGDFYTINISCPNAFGGEDFARPEALRELLVALKEIKSTKPLYFKMPINKSWDEFKDLVDVLIEFKVHGVVIGNLNKQYEDLDFPKELSAQEYRGGLSGKPCQKLSNQLIKQVRLNYPELTIIGCGGILSAEDALEKMRLGANLVQLISGMIFTGPHLINQINTLYQERINPS
jgi:dihydroorotate dehydrogenase